MASRYRPSPIQLLLLSNVVLLALLLAAVADRNRPEAPATTLVPAARAQSGALAQEESPPRSPMVNVVQNVSPSVVTISAVRSQVVRTWRDDWFVPYTTREVVREHQPWLGSGSVIDNRGFIVTNFHVIESAEQIFVTLYDGREIPARLIAAEAVLDIALLQVDAKDLPPALPLGDSDDLQIGESVLALGNPFGPMLEDPRPTVTSGVVSALHRSFRPDAEKQKVYQDMIQTDAAINPGNSGGPLVDALGRMIGMNTFIMSRSGGSQGIGFAIPVNRIRGLVEEVMEYGRVRPRLLDFEAVPLRTPRLQGLLIAQIGLKDGPAAQAGLQQGDVILAADNKVITTPHQLELVFAAKRVGEPLRLRLWRSGDTIEVTYRIEEYTQAPPVRGRL